VPRTGTHQGVSLPKELAERLKLLSGELKGRSINSICEQCCEEMLEMCDTPQLERTIPDLVKQVDSVRKVQRFADAEEAAARGKL